MKFHEALKLMEENPEVVMKHVGRDYRHYRVRDGQLVVSNNTISWATSKLTVNTAYGLDWLVVEPKQKYYRRLIKQNWGKGEFVFFGEWCSSKKVFMSRYIGDKREYGPWEETEDFTEVKWGEE